MKINAQAAAAQADKRREAHRRTVPTASQADATEVEHAMSRWCRHRRRRRRARSAPAAEAETDLSLRSRALATSPARAATRRVDVGARADSAATCRSASARDESALDAEMTSERTRARGGREAGRSQARSARAPPPRRGSARRRNAKHVEAAAERRSPADEDRDFIAAVLKPRKTRRLRRAAASRNGRAVRRGLRPSACSRRYFAQSVSLRLDVRGIDRDARDRADLDALRLVEVADALGALARVDDVDHHAHRDRRVRALGLAHVAVDALVGDHQRHDLRLTAPRA